MHWKRIPWLACLLTVCLLVACQAQTPAAGPLKLTRPAAPFPAALKIRLSAEGAYELTADDLDAAGFPKSAVNPAHFRLFLRGQPYPLDVVSLSGDYRLRFYGLPSDSRYTMANTYLLRYDASLPAVNFRAANASPATDADDVYQAQARLEQNLIYTPLAESGDGWFWTALPPAQPQTFEMALSQLAGDAGRLTLMVWSPTFAENEPDHHLRVSLGGQVVADETWDGKGYHVITAELSGLSQGVNTVEVVMPGDVGEAEKDYVDWIEIRYPRRALAEGDVLAFEGGARPLRVTGLSGAMTLWDVTTLTDTLRIANKREENVAPVEKGHRYLALGPQGFRKPDEIAPLMELPSLEGVSEVAIGPQALLSPLQPWVEHRAAQGSKVVAVPLEAVYDQFGDGFPEPEAIRRFLADVWQHTPALQFVLLVGDATYDPRGYTSPPEANRLPAFFTHTAFGGETVSDVMFALLDGDALPDLAVGRLPARTPQQVSDYVTKLLAYENQPPDGWQRRILAVADGQDASFRGDAQAFLNGFPQEWEKNLLAPEAGATDAHPQIIASWQEGYGIVAYFGHGSVNTWGKDRLFTADDVADLHNGARLPLVINMNCLTGLFTHPKTISLAEVLLWQRDGGAVAVLAPTSLTLPTDQALLSQGLVAALAAQPDTPIGRALLSAQQNMPADQQGVEEVRLTFLLFGDPALHLNLAPAP